MSDITCVLLIILLPYLKKKKKVTLWNSSGSLIEQLNYGDIWPYFSLCVQELEKALSVQDLDFLGDLITCLLQGCYQRNDIT